MIDTRSIQRALAAKGFDVGVIDGVVGRKTNEGVAAALEAEGLDVSGWPQSRRMIAINQWVMNGAGIDVGKIDGLMGPDTLHGIERWQDHLRETPGVVDKAAPKSPWPRQADMAKFYGEPGTGHTSLALPYPMRIAWDTKVTVNKITINTKCAASAGRALKAALDHYGYDRLRELGLDLFGGCYANRPMRGGKLLSTHAFAAALDINPEQNQLRWGADRAAMAHPNCAAFLDAFEAEGWVSLGRERNFDWMHTQAARL